jgi:hypothetical protein
MAEFQEPPLNAPQSTKQKKGLRAILINIFQVALVCILLSIPARLIIKNRIELEKTLAGLSLALLAVSWLASFLTHFAVGAGWGMIMRGVRPGLTIRRHMTIWAKTKLYQYLPGSIWHFVSRVQTYTTLGIPRTVTLVAITIEHMLIVISALVVGTLVISSWERISAAQIIMISSLSFAATVGLLYPKASLALLRLALKVLRRPNTIDELRYSFTTRLWLILIYIFGWAGKGFAFYLLVGALSPQPWSSLPPILGFFTTAWVVGFLTIFAPNGLGVREGILIYFLSQRLGINPGIASIASILSRLIVWISDVSFALLFALGDKGGSRRVEAFSE